MLRALENLADLRGRKSACVERVWPKSGTRAKSYRPKTHLSASERLGFYNRVNVTADEPGSLGRATHTSRESAQHAQTLPGGRGRETSAGQMGGIKGERGTVGSRCGGLVGWGLRRARCGPSSSPSSVTLRVASPTEPRASTELRGRTSFCRVRACCI